MPATYRIDFIDIDALKPHEAIKEKKAAHFSRFASRRKHLVTKPILIDRDSNVILDGHHRWFVCRELGCTKVPCVSVDYLADDSIIVLPRKPDIPVTKEAVIQMGLSGKTFPPKTTKHLFSIPMMNRLVDLKKYCRPS